MPAHTPAVRVVTETREKVYAGHEEFYPPLTKPAQSPELKKRQLYGKPNPKAKKDFWHDAPSGVGREIVRELLVCSACAERLRR